MNWLSFFIGALVGWLTEWVIDFVFWRRKRRALERANTSLQTRLAKTRAENRELLAQSSRYQMQEKELADCRLSLQSKEAELEAHADWLAGAQTTIEMLQGALATQEQQVAKYEADLQAKVSELSALSEKLASIEAALGTCQMERAAAEASVHSLEARLAEAETVVFAATQPPGPEPPAEPGVAAAPVPALVEPDDLRKIEGIGPAIARVLNDNGIMTYSQLASMGVSQLRQILEEAGPRFRLADPWTWPEQARLAASGDWEGLKDLQDRLAGGRI